MHSLFYYKEDDLNLDLQSPERHARLYQTGYLTIKSFNRHLRQYRLGIPNREINVE